MQARVCVQNFLNGSVQGFMYIDEGTGETLVTSSPIYASGSDEASGFQIVGAKGDVSATADVNVASRQVDFTIEFTSGGGGSTTTSMFSRPLAVSANPC